MDDKKKSVIYFLLILVLATAFIVLYLLDSNMTKSEGDDAFTTVVKSMKETSESINAADSDNNDNKENMIEKDAEKPDNNVIEYEEIKVIEWDRNDIDSIQVFSKRKDFSLINHGLPGEKKWSIKSVRLDEKIPPSNRALFKLLNVFEYFKTDNSMTKDYSEYAKYFDYPVCTIIVHFKDSSSRKLSFIRIAGYNNILDRDEMQTWARVDEETVVYAATYNILERFLVAESEFLKIY